MDLSRRYVCFFVFIGLFLLEKVLPCEFPSGRRLQCGTDSVSSSDQCPKTCCFDATTTPNCYFQENAYGPIQHSNGLCINVKNDFYTLIWSKDCTSRNAFFLVSYDHPPHHVASGKCVLPSRSRSDPGDSKLVLNSNSRDCNSNSVTYRPTENGNLEYYYILNDYGICIGNKSGGSPKENDYVYIPRKACQGDNICKHALSYVYQRKFEHRKNETIQCYVGRTIKIIWVNYDSTKTTCVSTKATKFMQEKCDGKTTCTFYISKADLLGSTSCSGDSNTFLIRYTCKVDAKPAAPNILNVLVKGQKELLIELSNDTSRKNNTEIKFKICYLHKTLPGGCYNVSSPQSSLTETLSGLQPATKYNVTVARYSCDESILGIERHKIAITRSAALKTNGNGEKSATSFQIQLGSLQGDDKYVQIIVSKLQSDTKPSGHPGDILQPYDVKTVDNQPYITAELTSNYVTKNSGFTVGDGKTYVGSGTRKRRSIDFQNVQLEPDTYYSVFQRTFETADLYYDSDWMDVIKTDKLPPTTTSSTPLTNVSVVTTEENTITQPGGGGSGDEKQDGGCSEGPSAGTEDGEKYLAAIIVLAILLAISFVIIAYFIYQIRRLKSSKANPETKTKDRNNSEEIDENRDNDDANYEQVENEQSTYTALKRPGPGEEESDDHLYTHLIEVHKDYVNQEETGF